MPLKAVGCGLLVAALFVPHPAYADDTFAAWGDFIYTLRSQLLLAYQFQYTQNRAGEWTPQHAIVFRYWFGARISARGR